MEEITDCTNSTNSELNDFDNGWKLALDEYFPEFMELFFPNAYQQIDWSKNYQLLNSELQQLISDSTVGNRRCDKLVKVWLNNDTEAVILIHIEVQGDYDATFAKRMFVYHYRIFDKFIDKNVELISLAVLGDYKDTWMPFYQKNLWDCDLTFKFPLIKLHHCREKLEKAINPFALIALSYLKSKDTKNDFEAKFNEKIRLYDTLHSYDWDAKKIISVMNLMEWLIALPTSFTERLKTATKQIQKEYNMEQRFNVIEQDARNQGLQQGVEQGKTFYAKQSISLTLATKFNETPSDIKDSLEEIQDIKTLEGLLVEAVKANSIEEFRVKLEEVK